MATLPNIEHYKARLLTLEASLTKRADRAIATARGEFMDVAHDTGDSSVADEVATEQFTEAELDTNVLTLIRDALARIEHGTYGTCLVDGGPIEAKRLEAVPWAPYCLRHAESASTTQNPRRVTL